MRAMAWNMVTTAMIVAVLLSAARAGSIVFDVAADGLDISIADLPPICLSADHHPGLLESIGKR
jgi:hypothetical protein